MSLAGVVVLLRPILALDRGHRAGHPPFFIRRSLLLQRKVG
jgi:hypothetical protein